MAGLRRADLSQYVNRVISDAVLMNESPSPTENEHARMEFAVRRLSNFGVSNIITDDAGNVAALFPAAGGEDDFLLVAAEVGDAAYSPIENSVQLSRGRAVGRGLGRQSLAPAALLVLAEFAQNTAFRLDKNLLLLFTLSADVDERNEALRTFLRRWAKQISCAIIVHGIGLGLVESRRLGTYRITVKARMPERDLLSHPSSSVAPVLGAIAQEVGRIVPGPASAAVINIARMEAGAGYGAWCSEGTLAVEILAEDEIALEAARDRVYFAIERVGGPDQEVTIETTVEAHRAVGDSSVNDPLTVILRQTLAQLRVKSSNALMSDQVALLNDHAIPAVAVGITTGGRGAAEEWIDIRAIQTGFRQLLLLAERYAERTKTQEREAV